ncbi:MAG: Holliday junction resolvase RuvX [Clostridia bacterium]|nr:Holliday junction resolvase RuvX [Clostridia bacterium]
MGRLMGLDYGSKTVGVALSDLLHVTASGFEVVRRPNEIDLKSTIERIVQIVKEQQVEKIVLGLPKHMNGDEGDSADKVKHFKEKLEKQVNVPIVLWDERLTTVQSHNMMKDAGMDWKKRNKVVDQVAACLILENYMQGSDLKMPW